MNAQTAGEVLRFWFGEAIPPAAEFRKQWFQGGPALDANIKARFGDFHAQLRSGLSDAAMADPLILLSAIIVIDQFSRNMFRQSAQAFAWDALAQNWALHGLHNGLFAQLSAIQQAFAVMPLMHSEDILMHQQVVAFFAALCEQQPETDTIITGFYSSARQHHDIIAQFGRYPHRNAVLGRESTVAEMAYLNDGAKRFGQ